MKTSFKFVGANPDVKCGELVIYGIKNPNEPFKQGELITIAVGEGRIKNKEDHDLLVSLLSNNGNFKEIEKKSVGRPPKINNDDNEDGD